MSPLPQDKNNTLIAGLDKSVAILGSKMEDVATDVKDIKQKLESSYATKEWVDAKYGNTKKQVDAIIWIIVSAVVVALVSLVVVSRT